jgi:uncharacterized iron-regulated membrane protein
VVAGLVILMMSVTGVLLTYERQVLAWSDRSLVRAPADAGARPLGVTQLLAAAERQEPEFAPSSVTLSADRRAPVSMSAGRGNSRLLDPWTGEMLTREGSGLHAFFDTVMGWHRWFNIDGEHRDAARAITGACNLAFLFLVLSGLYLWLPPVYNRVAFRTRYWFNAKVQNSKARDFNWHHVFGIWSAIPLAVIVASATVFYYGWANALVYRVVGEEPPAGGPPQRSAQETVAEPVSGGQTLEALAETAAAEVAGWRSLTMTLPAASDPTVQFSVDRGTGGQPQHRYDVVIDATTGEVLSSERFAGTTGRRARMMLRFLHTGEALGVGGQTLAGIVSLTSTLMVWTGLALAWRRLVSPLLARRRSRKREPAADTA